MAPMTPDEIAHVIHKHHDVTLAEIDEYQRLEGQRFHTDPDLPLTQEQIVENQTRDARIKELHKKFYGF